ncbi:DUF4440 domain-containing protein [Tamlana crocina]|uniref:DUF4440 domain-containing protein n=1 Tax=Tamlana crocina TaxID=393006 RepID=A0ABX1DHR3_9FLAO|nr:DUF4440 domain-containing protein [Tamlana crocina]NJX15856.1 DUF4440 domain-containing protein [Tamlana crocina]
MKKLFLLTFLFCGFFGFSQANIEDDIKAINKVLKKQRIAWSNYNLEEYMDAYWKSDSLKFYSSHGVIEGWYDTFDRYEKAYPTEKHTGKLSYKINAITPITNNSYYILGEYHIKRDMGNADGIFMLVVKSINGDWKIIAHTTT